MIDSVENMSQDEEIRQIYDAMSRALDEKQRQIIEVNAKKFSEEELDLKIVGKKYIQAIIEGVCKRHLNEELLQEFSEKYLKNQGYTDMELKKLAKTLSYSVGGFDEICSNNLVS